MVWTNSTKHETVSADGKKATLAIPPDGLPDQKTEGLAARPTKHVQPSGLRPTGARSTSGPFGKQKAGPPRSTGPHTRNAPRYGSCSTGHRSRPDCAAFA